MSATFLIVTVQIKDLQDKILRGFLDRGMFNFTS